MKDKNMKDSVTVNGVKYIREQAPGSWVVFVLDFGWILVGQISSESKAEVCLVNAKNIRNFGAGTGVSGIVNKKGLKLDDYHCPVFLPKRKITYRFILPEEWAP
jgi:hypothetical protein